MRRGATVWFLASISAGFWVLGSAAVSQAQIAGQAPELDAVGVDEHLGAALPLDATFRDHTGRPVRLGDLIDGERPVVLNFAYYSCPVLCNMVLDATTTAMNGVLWTVGDEYQFISISIDPRDTPERAAQKRTQVIASYDRAQDGEAQGWSFLTGTQEQIARVTEAAGFKYIYNEAQEQYGHPAAMMLLTPDGKVARYLYGLRYASNDVRLGLLEASEGRSISTLERVIIYCYRYDPQGKTYAIVAIRVMQIGGGLTALLLGGFLLMFWRHEWKGRALKKSAAEASTEVARS